MSAERNLPPARARGRGGAAIAALIVVFVAAMVAFAGGWMLRRRAARVLTAGVARRRRAWPTCFEARCARGLCQSLWIGQRHAARRDGARCSPGRSEQARRDRLDAGRPAASASSSTATSCALFDGRTGANLGAVSLIEPDGIPSSRIARGVTFSANGAAVTFDDCPRAHSGCKPGLVAAMLTAELGPQSTLRGLQVRAVISLHVRVHRDPPVDVQRVLHHPLGAEVDARARQAGRAHLAAAAARRCSSLTIASASAS